MVYYRVYYLSLFAVLSWLFWNCHAVDVVEGPISTPSDLRTSVGCNETVECSAVNDTTVQWSTTRFEIAFVNNSRRFTWVTTTGAITTAFLRFVNISTQEKGRYTCFKANGASTNTFTVFVDQNNILINAQPSFHNLSRTFFGRTLTIPCVVDTCGRTTVTFTRLGSPETDVETITRDVNNQLSFNWNAMVTASLAGSYRCTAVNFLGTNSSTFTISGTPNRAAGSISIVMSTTLLVAMLLLATILNL